MQRVKNMFKRNQVMITALAIMIAIAGYLNFAGTKITDEELVSADAHTAEEDMSALLDLSEEDLTAEIYSLDSEDEGVAVENFLNEDMQVVDNSSISIVSDYMDEGEAEGIDDPVGDGMSAEYISQEAEVSDGETPGEAVYTSSSGLSVLSGARLMKEQTRSKTKETLLEIINNANISEAQKQEAVTDMIELTDRAERETAAEILLDAKGFSSAVVTITGDSADVVVGLNTLTDVQCAQIEDIVARKTGVSAQNIVINPMTAQ